MIQKTYVCRYADKNGYEHVKTFEDVSEGLDFVRRLNGEIEEGVCSWYSLAKACDMSEE